MQKSSFISVANYNYNLPENRIAKYPLPHRDSSKILVYSDGSIQTNEFTSLTHHLPHNSLLFMNNTKVVHARLLFRRKTGAAIEVFCLSPFEPADYQSAFSGTEGCIWECMIGNLKKWKGEFLELTTAFDRNILIVNAEKIGALENRVLVRFTWNKKISFGQVMELTGNVPIPPYLNRNSERIDEERYQTTYSKFDGSVAAPTAGLHFTQDSIDRLRTKEIRVLELTLHVGAGTFQPILSENIMEHTMHSEFFSIGIDVLKELVSARNFVTATGTTSLRTLESIYWLALKSVQQRNISTILYQWEYLHIEPVLPYKTAIRELIKMMEGGRMNTFSARTSIMIIPGYKFQVVDALITNFHQPKSTLLLLIAAFIGEDWKRVYNYALENDYRFLSYGDSSLLFRTE